MKRIPEKFELSEEDIRSAISYWLKLAHGVDSKTELDIQFSVDRVAVAPPSGAPVGGMSDFTKQAISAVAAKKG